MTTEAGAYDVALGLLCVIGGPVSPDRRNGPRIKYFVDGPGPGIFSG